MPKIRPVYLDSNFCRYPQTIRSYGAHESLALDLLVFIASKTHRPNYKTNPINLHVHQRVYFHAGDFCKEFSRPRQTITAKLSDQAKANLKDYSKKVQSEIVSQLDYTLFMMTARSAIFEKHYKIAGPDGKIIVEHEGVQVFSKLITNRAEERRLRTQAISYSMDVLAGFIGNNHHRGQSFFLEDYLNVRTTGGKDDDERTPTTSGKERKAGKPRAWAAGRRLFLRLIWKWGWWQEENRRTQKMQLDDFEELCDVVQLLNGPDKLRASRLRAYLEDVCRMGNLPFTAEVVKVRPDFTARQLNGKTPPPYQVILTKRAEKQQQPGLQQSLAM